MQFTSIPTTNTDAPVVAQDEDALPEKDIVTSDEASTSHERSFFSMPFHADSDEKLEKQISMVKSQLITLDIMN